MTKSKIKLYKKLLPYQEECVNKLNKMKVGANFMDMGTGKTITTVAIASRKWGKYDKILWFCPVSTIENLKRGLSDVSNILELDILEICGIESIFKGIRVVAEV